MTETAAVPTDKEERHAWMERKLAQAVAYQVWQLRVSRRWSQRQLAKKAGLSTQVIVRIENGDLHVGTKSYMAIANAFDVALLIRFASFGEFADFALAITGSWIAPVSYTEEA